MQRLRVVMANPIDDFEHLWLPDFGQRNLAHERRQLSGKKTIVNLAQDKRSKRSDLRKETPAGVEVLQIPPAIGGSESLQRSRDAGSSLRSRSASPTPLLLTALHIASEPMETDHIDLYQVSKDPAVPIEDAVGAIGDLVQQGYVRYVGLTNVDVETVRRGHATHPLTALQLEYSLMSRDIEHTVLPLCRELGIGVTAYGVLSRGLLTGSNGEGDGDVRQKFYSRFQGENLAHNRRLAEELGKVAASAGISTAQAAIGWVASQGQDIIPLVGARTVERLGQALRSPLILSQATLAAIRDAVPENAVRGK